jgi:S-layer protein
LSVGYGTSITDSDGQAVTPATVIFTVNDARTTAKLALEAGGLSPSVVTAADTAAAAVTNNLLSVIPAAMNAGIAAASTSADKTTVISSLMATANGASSLTSTADRTITRIADANNFNLLLNKISDTLTALAVAGTLSSAELQTAVTAVNNALSSAGADADEIAGYETTFNNAITADIAAESSLAADYTTAVTTATASSSSAGTVAGTSYDLTDGIDTITGTAANDTINALDSTLTAFDTIDGKGGTDTLNLTNLASGGFTGGSTATVSNVENLVVKSGSGAISIDASGWTGLSSVVVQQTGTKAAIGVTTKAPSVTISGGITVDVYDNQTTGDTLASVSVDGNTGAVTIGTDALTNLTVANTSQNVTVTAAAATRTLSVGLDTVTSNARIADNETTSLALSVSGGAASVIGLHAKNATSIAIATADSDNLTISDLNTAQNTSAKTSLTITGTANVTISDTSPTDDNLTSINAAGASGTIDLDAFTLNTDTAYTGSAGIDTIKVGATTAAIALGAGNDNLTLTLGAASLTTGTIDGGDGDDILNMNADNASNASLSDNISNFEYLVVTDDTDNYTINLANLDNITNVTFNAAGLTANAKTISGVISGSTLTFVDNQVDNTTISVANASTGTADVLNLVASSSSALTFGDDSSNFVRVQNVETINITTDDTATTPTGIQHTLSLVADNMTTLNVSGDAGIDLDNLTNSNASTGKLTSINTSGVTTGVVKITTAANDNVTFVGGDTATVISMAAITSSGNTSSVTTGAGADNVTGGAGVDTISTGAGNDNITAGAGADVITAGAGNDWIYGGAGADTMTGGADNDTFYFGAVTDSTSSASDTITDFGTYDIIDLSAFTTDNGSYTGTITGSQVIWASNGASEAKMDSTGAVYVDVDGNGSLTSADIVFTITGAPTLDNATNFRF